MSNTSVLLSLLSNTSVLMSNTSALTSVAATMPWVAMLMAVLSSSQARMCSKPQHELYDSTDYSFNVLPHRFQSLQKLITLISTSLDKRDFHILNKLQFTTLQLGNFPEAEIQKIWDWPCLFPLRNHSPLA